jgi:hypothetical protein
MSLSAPNPEAGRNGAIGQALHHCMSLTTAAKNVREVHSGIV